MKRLFMTMSRGFLARNILQTDIYPTLLNEGVEIVIATPAYKDEDFLRTFQRPGVTFVPMEIPAWTLKEQFFGGLQHNLVWNRTIQFTARYGVYDPDAVSCLRPWLQWLWRPFANRFGRRLARWLDRWLCPPSEAVLNQVREARPDLVFSTNPMESWDSYYVKAAQQLGIPTVGFVKSWDNMTKTSFRVRTDDVIVWGPYMTEEARTYQDYPPERIHEFGVPQFDPYFRRDARGRVSREALLRSGGLDPARATILFGSEGKVTPNDPDIVSMIATMIHANTLPVPAQVWVRPHYGYKDDDQKFCEVEKDEYIFVDRHFQRRPVFYDGWDYSREHYLRLADTLFACDVLVTTASTLAIDAAVCGIPVITIAFDGYKTYDHRHSIARWYETEYYANVLETGALAVVHSYEELQEALTQALLYPNQRSEERAALVRRIAGTSQGHAGTSIGLFLATYEPRP